MNKTLLGLGLLLAAFATFGQSRTLISLENGKVENPDGGAMGSWGTRGGRAKMSVHRDEDKNYALRFEYNVSQPRQDAGFWYALQHLDVRPFDSIRFQVKGEKGGEMMAFGFKDDRWYEERISIEKYLDQPIGREWQTVTIPLRDFAKVRQWDSLDNFSISFLNSEKFLPKSTVYVRDVEVVQGGKSKNKKWYVKDEKRETFAIPFDPEDATDDQLLDLVERAAFGFFWNEANPRNGLVKDRCYAFGPDQRKVASVACVGFALSSICIADKRGWIQEDLARDRVLTTLKFFNTEAQMYNGFYFHFYEMDTGAPLRGSEISSVDTGLFLMGVITAKQYYKGTEIEEQARQILEKVDWPWMTNGEKFLSHGWFPGNKFLPHYWRDYNEAILLYFLAVSSPTHPLPDSVWKQIDREVLKYKNFQFVPAAGENSLFEHQYPQCWLDLRGLVDSNGVDYFDNSVIATQANREWCADNASKFKTFEAGFWGLTACDGPQGYVINGAPFAQKCDGTVAPTATLASLPFTPELSVGQLRKYFALQKNLWGKYGFVDSFNLDSNWFSSVHLGIDQGPILLMIENQRSGMIWDLIGREPMVQESFKKLGFKKTEIPEAPAASAGESGGKKPAGKK